MSRAELPSAYEPADVESAIYADWESSGVFHAEVDDPGEPFSIVIPPPNVTGSLHIGHALDNAIQDAIVRRARMQGYNAVWVPGTDHAGIATQNVVERQLAERGVSRHDLGREAFVEHVWRWRQESGGMILRQLRRLGASCDWEREAFTFDELRSRAVREVFVSLYEQDLVYRGYRLINWCPRCHTALSDIEVEHVEVPGELAHLRYPGTDGSEGVVVATTRAETMLGDTAVAVHPDDERYAHLVGSTLRLPLVEREIPVIADDHVDPAFGSGAVKITPAHDPNDYEIGLRHDLPQIDIMSEDARINDHGGRFAGLTREAARTAVKEALAAEGLLVGVDEHTHSVGHCSRCSTVVEPRLSDQWFVSVRPLADKAHAAVDDGRIRFSPPRFTKPFTDWLENLHDWCISRQLWWGHRIPVWYCDACDHMTVSRTDPDACEACGGGSITQDPDVLDTWFSSQLWPFSVFGWPDQTPELDTWFPTTVLVTGYDINTFWVSRMAMISLWFLDEVPFHVVHNHGMVRDRHGKKMSKSFGNVIDPLEFIDRYGADALRFALFSHCGPGADVPLAEEWVEGAKRFANKLWNAIRFASSHLDAPGADGSGFDTTLPPADELALEDRWILSRLAACHATVDAAYEHHDWATASDALYAFAWRELADWYLEVAKVRLAEADSDGARVARAVLGHVLDHLLRLLHPLMPFVTEALWRHLSGSAGGTNSLMCQSWPVNDTTPDPTIDASFGVAQDLVTELRRFRAEHDVTRSVTFEVTVVTDAPELLTPTAPLVERLVGLDALRLVDDVDEAGTSKIVFSRGTAYVPLAGLVDLDAERERLDKELANVRKQRTSIEGKLANQDYVTRAPAEVVQRDRDRLEHLVRAEDELTGQLAALG